MPKNSTESTDQDWQNNLRNSLFVGGVVGVGFNFWDRALHLSMTNKRKFLLKANFAKPMRGAGVTAFLKPVTSGTYLFMQTELRNNMYPFWLKMGLAETVANSINGLISGASEGVIKTPCNAIKAFHWNHDTRPFITNIQNMWHSKGIRGFSSGACMTMQRDALFGALYESTRMYLRAYVPQHNCYTTTVLNFTCDSLGAGVATLGSSPFNYARLMQQNSKTLADSPGFFQVVKTLITDTQQHNGFFAKTRFLLRVLSIGPGTFRTMADMPTKQFLLLYAPYLFSHEKRDCHATVGDRENPRM